MTSRALAIPRQEDLRFFGDDHSASAFASNLDRLKALGFSLTEIDFGPFEFAGRLVFQSAFVAERLYDYGDLIVKQPDAVHPSVRASIVLSFAYTARDAFEALYEMKRLQRVATVAVEGFAALVVPTVPTIFTIEEMLQEPMSRNTIMGTYTYFVNPLDLCAISVPGAKRDDGLPSALCLVGAAAEDGICVLSPTSSKRARTDHRLVSRLVREHPKPKQHVRKCLQAVKKNYSLHHSPKSLKALFLFGLFIVPGFIQLA